MALGITENNEAVVPRLIFNFTGKCNMVCPYCYIPFDLSPVDRRKVKEVLKATLHLNPVSITFGGGDPFMFHFFPQLLLETKRYVPFIQVDTNAKCLREEHVPLLEETVDLLGLPLDGTDKSSHGKMRNDMKHFDIVLSWLKRLSKSPIPIKVNTVVSRKNLSAVVGIGQILKNLSIGMWSLYQFWPMAESLLHEEEFRIDPDSFEAIVSEAKRRYPEVRIEAGSVTERSSAYVFVTHWGKVYSVDPSDNRKYVDLGTIFAPDLRERIQEYVDADTQLRRIKGRMMDE